MRVPVSGVVGMVVWAVMALPGRAAPASTPPAGSPSASVAVSTPEPEEAARQAVKRGLAAFARGEARTALAEYQHAQQLVPKANLPYRYAGEAYASLGQIEEAIASYETYLSVKPDVGDADLVRARIEQLRGKLVGVVMVSSLPSGAEVFLDDEGGARGRTPLRIERVPRGAHRLSLRLGERRVAGAVQVDGGAEASVALEFSAAPVVEPPALGPRPVATGGGLSLRTVGFGVGALGGAALATGLVIDVGVLTKRIDDYDAAARRGDGTAGRKRPAIERLQTVGLVSYLGGAALVGTGVVLVLVGRAGHGAQATVGPSGVSFAGWF